jgi:hypothetical protein
VVGLMMGESVDEERNLRVEIGDIYIEEGFE